ncbi:hypothetical protein L6452_25221 [Arctium lappa]|uniref:Uncharacterized protein n=1 Tax=Arctium lappa TaxID=4217 RepID=A0ACB9AAM6_ARCLA|nr:hypothetical protein L6452_25221 [Arctium lappa]
MPDLIARAPFNLSLCLDIAQSPSPSLVTSFSRTGKPRFSLLNHLVLWLVSTEMSRSHGGGEGSPLMLQHVSLFTPPSLQQILSAKYIQNIQIQIVVLRLICSLLPF